MASTAWIIIGILILLLGIGMIVGSLVWHFRSDPLVWSNGMIALLFSGIFVIIIGIILIINGSLMETIQPIQPIPIQPIPIQPIPIQPENVQITTELFENLLKMRIVDPLSDEKISVGDFRARCAYAPANELANSIIKGGPKGVHTKFCSDVLGTKLDNNPRIIYDPVNKENLPIGKLRQNCNEMSDKSIRSAYENYPEVYINCADIIQRKFNEPI